MLQNIKDKLYNFIYDKKTLEQKDILCKISSLEECNVDNILSKHFILTPPTNVTLSADIYRDIEFWANVFPTLNKHCHYSGGGHILRSLLSAPNSDLNILEKRKAIIKNHEAILEDTDLEKLKKIKELETTVLWSFQELDENIDDLYNMLFFKMMLFRKGNLIPEALTGYNIYRIIVSPMVGLLSPIIYFLIPYIIVVYKFKLNLSFIDYLRITLKTMMNSDFLSYGFGGAKYKSIQVVSYIFSLVFYFQGVFNSFEISKTLYKVSKHLSGKMTRIAEFLNVSVELVSKYWKEDMTELFGIGNKLKGLTDEIAYVQTLSLKNFNLLGNFGKFLTSYKTLSKDIIQSLLHKIYVLDSITALVLFKREYSYGYTEFINKTDKPMMKLNGLRHPCIDQEKCVPNDITLGGVSRPNNVIITGTNAGGKSVMIKGILVNALLSQTCAISCCDNAAITPLRFINSQVNVPDMIGHESLFEAEMHRCKKNLEALKVLDEGFSLIVMDEIFSSTNPIEAISGAYAVCKKMSECKNNLLVFTTHFNYLTKLKKTGRFLNYKMETIVSGGGAERSGGERSGGVLGDIDINFTYKLVPGVNKQFLALELLKKNGFDADIIEEALAIKNKFMS